MHSVPVITLGDELADALRAANLSGQLLRGLESAEKTLAAEARGLDMADRKAESPRGARVSRLLILSNDGSERFYRQVETLLDRHGTRLLVIRVEADESALGQALYGEGGRARLVMVERKESVARVLLSLAEDQAG